MSLKTRYKLDQKKNCSLPNNIKLAVLGGRCAVNTARITGHTLCYTDLTQGGM